jgi:hypothetical protein
MSCYVKTTSYLKKGKMKRIPWRERKLGNLGFLATVKSQIQINTLINVHPHTHLNIENGQMSCFLMLFSFSEQNLKVDDSIMNHVMFHMLKLQSIINEYFLLQVTCYLSI